MFQGVSTYKSVFAGLAVTAALGLAACGDDDKGGGGSSGAAAPATQPAGGGSDTSGGTGGAAAGGGGGGAKIAIAADPSGQFAFDKKTLNAKAGKVEVDFTNQSPVPHNFSVEAEGDKDIGETQTIMKSKTSKTLDLKPGKYEFYCSVDGHRQGGMEGTLTVK